YTRFSRDWSLDVCSSDLIRIARVKAAIPKPLYIKKLLMAAPNLLRRFSASTSRFPNCPRTLWSVCQLSIKETKASRSARPKNARKLPRITLVLRENLNGFFGTEGCFTFLLVAFLAIVEFRCGQKYKLGPANRKKSQFLWRINRIGLFGELRA